MELKHKFIMAITVLVFMVVAIYIPTSAENFTEIPLLEKTNPPENWSFSVLTERPEVLYFFQAHANKSGNVAVQSRYLHPEEINADTFVLKFIDLYHTDGSYWKTYSYRANYDGVVQLSDDYMYLYFHQWVLVCDLETDEVEYYATLEGAVKETGLYWDLLSAKFTCGQWNYTCKKTMGDYTKLTRTNGQVEQVLVEMPGQVKEFHFPLIISAVICISLVSFVLIRKRNK